MPSLSSLSDIVIVDTTDCCLQLLGSISMIFSSSVVYWRWSGQARHGSVERSATSSQYGKQNISIFSFTSRKIWLNGRSKRNQLSIVDFLTRFTAYQSKQSLYVYFGYPRFLYLPHKRTPYQSFSHYHTLNPHVLPIDPMHVYFLHRITQTQSPIDERISRRRLLFLSIQQLILRPCLQSHYRCKRWGMQLGTRSFRGLEVWNYIL